jgi:hypothetical protein
MYISDVPIGLSSVVTQFRDELLSLIEHRGIDFTVSYVKTSRNAVMRYISGEPLKDTAHVKLVGGFPKWLSHFQPHVDDPNVIKILLTLLTLTRAISLKPLLDTSTITEP